MIQQIYSTSYLSFSPMKTVQKKKQVSKSFKILIFYLGKYQHLFKPKNCALQLSRDCQTQGGDFALGARSYSCFLLSFWPRFRPRRRNLASRERVFSRTANFIFFFASSMFAPPSPFLVPCSGAVAAGAKEYRGAITHEQSKWNRRRGWNRNLERRDEIFYASTFLNNNNDDNDNRYNYIRCFHCLNRDNRICPPFY